MSSAREIAAQRERREWVDKENKRVRAVADRNEYAVYVEGMKRERLTPLSFDEWAKFLPQDTDDPKIRGASATNRATWASFAKAAKERILDQRLEDAELSEFGFDIRYRPDHELEGYSPAVIADLFSRFRDREPRFDVSQIEQIGGLLQRNRLTLVEPHIELAFNILLGLGVIQPKPAPVTEPDPPRPEGINRFGINLQIETDPALEARKRREKYETEVIVVCPETGRHWTQLQIDKLADSETYRRLMRLPRITKNPALEPRH
jgi:hypothetical protein